MNHGVQHGSAQNAANILGIVTIENHHVFLSILCCLVGKLDSRSILGDVSGLPIHVLAISPSAPLGEAIDVLDYLCLIDQLSVNLVVKRHGVSNP